MNEAEKKANEKITHKWFKENSPVQQYVQYAYDIWGMDLVLLIECENGNWNMYQQSTVVRNWRREDSWWFCQIHRPDHKEIVNNDLFWSDWKRQLDRCKELMDKKTPFFWRDRKVKWMRCSDYVKSRFTLEQAK